MKLTIAYITSRKAPMFHWFARSLTRELEEESPEDTQLIVVDFWNQEMPADGWDAAAVLARREVFASKFGIALQHVAPCGSVWQGPHRRTKENYFAASNARNTALMLARHDWIVIVDDLSVMMPGYLKAVREAINGNYIMCGAYRKVKNLEVGNDGSVKFDDYAPGWDHRWKYGNDNAPVLCGGGWMYGCSFAAPVEAFLRINGYPLVCDGMGYEDSVTGNVIERNGYQFRYDRRALTIESEEHHHLGKQMRREDPGISPADKSHAMLAMFSNAVTFGDNYYEVGGLRKIREEVLAGRPLPDIGVPENEWFTGKRLSEL